MRIYKNCNVLSIYLFHKLISTNDLKYLVHKRDRENLTEKDKESLKEVMVNIVDEYYTLTSNDEEIRKRKAEAKLVYLHTVKNAAVNCLKTFDEYRDLEVLTILNSLKNGFGIDFKKPLEAEIKKNLNKIKGMNNRINIEQIKYDQRFNSKDNKKSNQEFDLEKEALRLSISLKLNKFLNPKKTSVSKWLKLHDINKQNLEYGKVEI